MVEHLELTIEGWYQIEWRKQGIDLTELAKRRWIDKMQIDELAQKFGRGSTQIKFHLNRISANPNLVNISLNRQLRKYAYKSLQLASMALEERDAPLTLMR